jgi:hypothetical protein
VEPGEVREEKAAEVTETEVVLTMMLSEEQVELEPL